MKQLIRIAFSLVASCLVAGAIGVSAAAPPRITADPDIAVVADAGSEASFTASADPSTATVQWQFAPDREGPWTDIPGATDATLTFTSTDVTGDTFALGNAYRAVFTNGGGTTISRPAKLVSRARWMRDFGRDIAFLPLTELTIPGAHDMGTYGMTGNSDVSTDEQGFLCDTIGHNPCHSYGQAQDNGKDAAAELADGIRYFDLRVCGHAVPSHDFDEESKRLMTCHALEGAPLQDILDQTRAFVGTHPGEVVILDFNHHFELNPDIEAARIEQAFTAPDGSSLLIPPQYCTAGDLDSGTCARLTLHSIAQQQLGSVIVNFENDGAPGATTSRCLPQQTGPNCFYTIQPVLDAAFYDRHPLFWGRLSTTPVSNDQCTFGASFPSCFGNDSDVGTVLSRVRASLSDNAHYAVDPATGVDARRFFVQFLQTTPNGLFIFENLTGSLLDMAMGSNPQIGPSIFNCGLVGDCFAQVRAENLNVLAINYYNRTDYTVGHTLVPPLAGECHDGLNTCPLTPAELKTLLCVQDTETFQVTSCEYEDLVHFDFVEETLRLNGYARTAPVVSVHAPLDPAPTGWYNAAVLGGQGAQLRVDVSGEDFRYPTGISALDCSDGAAFTSLTAATSATSVSAHLPLGDGFHALDCRSTDGAVFGFHAFGHRGAGPGSTPAPVSLLVDTTPPQIQCPAAAYTLNQPVTFLTATVTDATSGPVSPSVNAPVSTAVVGSFSVPVSAADVAGNTSTVTCFYTVSYQIALRYDVTKPHQSGSVVSIHVELDDFAGVDVGGRDIPVTSTTVTNVHGTLDFQTSQGRGYVFDLKTTGYAAGDYALNFTAGGDPQPHAAPFVIR